LRLYGNERYSPINEKKQIIRIVLMYVRMLKNSSK
jgi:hypothetical protein